MSSPGAIAAVTAAVRDLLVKGTSAPRVTVAPPTEKTANGAKLNLFLYHVKPNTAWRSADEPRTWPGEPAVLRIAPLALDLQYLLTAYGDGADNPDIDAHRLLGEAMAVLHDQPLLDPERIRAISTGALAGVELDRQVERVRFTLQPLAVDELTKLWSGFQTGMRLSAAYEASVVLIQSKLPAYRAQPVLRRGFDDRGVFVSASGPPQIKDIAFPARDRTGGQPAAAQLGEDILISGSNLLGDALGIELRPLPGTGVIERPAVVDKRGRLRVRLSPRRPARAPAPDPRRDSARQPAWNTRSTADDEPEWRAGFYSVTIVTQTPDDDAIQPTAAGSPRFITRWSNLGVFPLAPRLEKIEPPAALANREVELVCRVEPRVLPEQRVEAIIGGVVAPARSRAEPANELRFVFKDTLKAKAGEKELARVRIDGVENISLDPDSSLPQFNPRHEVVIP